jgi:hypothetical protein
MDVVATLEKRTRRRKTAEGAKEGGGKGGDDKGAEEEKSDSGESEQDEDEYEDEEDEDMEVVVTANLEKSLWTPNVINTIDKAFKELDESEKEVIAGPNGVARTGAMRTYILGVREQLRELGWKDRPHVARYVDAWKQFITPWWAGGRKKDKATGQVVLKEEQITEPVVTPSYVTFLEGYWEKYDSGLIEVSNDNIYSARQQLNICDRSRRRSIVSTTWHDNSEQRKVKRS